jgi:hypothetical protein
MTWLHLKVDISEAEGLREAIVASGRNLHNISSALVGRSVVFSTDKDVNRWLLASDT